MTTSPARVGRLATAAPVFPLARPDQPPRRQLPRDRGWMPTAITALRDRTGATA